MSVTGRKNASFTKEQLKKLLNKKLSYREIKFNLNSGEKKIRDKMKEWGLTKNDGRFKEEN